MTNGTDTVPVGILQMELGGIYSRDDAADHSFGSPVAARLGLMTWLEASIETNAVLYQTANGVSASGFGDVALGAKVRLWDTRGALPAVSIKPSIGLPTASAEKGLGSGDPDYRLTLLAGHDVGSRGHVDANYAVGAIGAGNARPHFVQHLLSASGNIAVSARWAAYGELYWISREDPDGAAITAMDTGVIYRLTPRLALDAGVQAGVSSQAPGFAAFGGVSFMIGRGRATSAFR